MRILTNMVFWQSQTWTTATESIFPLTPSPETTKRSVLWQTCRLWKQARAFDIVVTMGSRESLCYGLLCGVTHRHSKQIMTEVFIDQPQPATPFWHAKNALFRWISRRSTGILTNSSSEVETIAQRYCVPLEKIRYVPMHTNIIRPEFQEYHDGSIFSAGYTFRDYTVLLKAAPAIRAPITILCSNRDAIPPTLPANVNVLRELPYNQYLERLKRCSVVAIPLQHVERSTGQVALLEAMALGKPVVTTRVPGTTDYIRNNENGILVEAGDAEGLANALNQLLDRPDWATMMAKVAFTNVLQHFTIEMHAQNKLQAISELWRQDQPEHHGGTT